MGTRHVLALGLLVACGKVADHTPPDAASEVSTCDATFTVSDPPRVDEAVTFTAVATPGATYAWSFTDGSPATSADPIPTATFTAVANHTVTLTVTNGTCMSTSTQAVCPGMAGTHMFDFTGAMQPFDVPACISSIKIDAFGAAGAAAGTQAGGLGGLATGTATVTPGESLVIMVGGQGPVAPTTGSAAGYPGGFNGGGGVFEYTGWTTQAEGLSGTGGGASDVRQGGMALANRIIVAGGGGGAGNSPGGAGGGITGGDGTTVTANTNSQGGGGGKPTAGGTTGNCCASYPNTPGALGAGGNGYRDASASAGGGGGYYGGGGGQFAGGGGGASFLGTLNNPSTTANVQPGNGKIVLTW
ncbi:MAG TPA: glycine-rich protein [Kofleriaceae bacterium]|jgi:hypothetical protein|nr:glycine-rich protein [Kofleriaceae bacterium]